MFSLYDFKVDIIFQNILRILIFFDFYRIFVSNLRIQFNLKRDVLWKKFMKRVCV